MGAWNFVDRRIEKVLSRLDMKVRRPVYVGRDAAASPATGSGQDPHGAAGAAGSHGAGDRLTALYPWCSAPIFAALSIAIAAFGTATLRWRHMPWRLKS